MLVTDDIRKNESDEGRAINVYTFIRMMDCECGRRGVFMISATADEGAQDDSKLCPSRNMKCSGWRGHGMGDGAKVAVHHMLRPVAVPVPCLIYAYRRRFSVADGMSAAWRPQVDC